MSAGKDLSKGDLRTPQQLTFGSVVGRMCLEAFGSSGHGWSDETFAAYEQLLQVFDKREIQEACRGAFVWSHFEAGFRDWKRRTASEQIPFEAKAKAVDLASRFIDGRFEEQDLNDYNELSDKHPELAKVIREVLQNEEP